MPQRLPFRLYCCLGEDFSSIYLAGISQISLQVEDHSPWSQGEIDWNQVIGLAILWHGDVVSYDCLKAMIFNCNCSDGCAEDTA